MSGKRKRSSVGEQWKRAYKRSSAASKIQKAFRGRRRAKTNKQLTRAVNKLWKTKAIKQHYVEVNNQQVNQLATQVVALTGIGAGDANNTHEGDSIRLRGLNIHGRCSVGQSGGLPTINGPKTVTILVVRSELGTSPAEIPTFAMIFRNAGINQDVFPLTMNFRNLYTETTTKLKILARRDMILEPHGPYDPAAAPPTSRLATYPSTMNFKMAVPVRNTKINYRPGTDTTVNHQLFLMIYSNAGGTATDLGPRVSLTSKLTFYDLD